MLNYQRVTVSIYMSPTKQPYTSMAHHGTLSATTDIFGHGEGESIGWRPYVWWLNQSKSTCWLLKPPFWMMLHPTSSHFTHAEWIYLLVHIPRPYPVCRGCWIPIFDGTWWLIPLLVSGLVHPSDLHGISRVNPLIIGVITHLRAVGCKILMSMARLPWTSWISYCPSSTSQRHLWKPWQGVT